MKRILIVLIATREQPIIARIIVAGVPACQNIGLQMYIFALMLPFIYGSACLHIVYVQISA